MSGGGCCRGGAWVGGGGACGSLPKKGMRQKTCQKIDPPYGDASPLRNWNVLRVEMVLRDGDGPPLQRELNGAPEWDRGGYGASRGELSQ